ncbi:hypothetical protein ABPG75_002737 [Micractinium tetrahymenae]
MCCGYSSQQLWESFPIAGSLLGVPGLPHWDYVAATFLAYGIKMDMPLRTLLGVGRHVWDGMQQHDNGLVPPFYARGPDFFPAGVHGFCQALLASDQLPKGLSHADMQRLWPLLEQVAACTGLPKQVLMQRLADALAPFIHLSPAACGIVYVRLPGRRRKLNCSPVVITDKVLASPKALKAAMDAAAERVWAAGEGLYVGSSARHLPGVAGADLPEAVLRSRRCSPTCSVVLICEAASAQLPMRLAEQHILNRCGGGPGLPRLENRAPLVYLHNLSGGLGRRRC